MPALRSWRPYTKRRPSEAELLRWFGDGAERNVFVVTGAISGAVVIDGDSEGAERYWRERLGDVLDRTACVATGRGHHYWFSINGSSRVASWSVHEGDVSFDVRAEGTGVIVPPSLHASGSRYRWVRGLEHLQPAPAALLNGAGGGEKSGDTERGRGGGQSHLADLLRSPAAEGGRNVWLTQVAGHYAKAFAGRPDVYQVHVERANASLPEPLGADEVEKVATSVGRKEAAKSQGTEDRFRLYAGADMAQRETERGRVGWLVRGLWPADGYGVLAGEDKAGKTWTVLDLAVAAAVGGRWHGHHDTGQAGPVVLYLGEGGVRATDRRLRALTEFHGCRPEDLRGLVYAPTAPQLTSSHDLEIIRDQLAQYQPRLTILDPLYLSAAGAKGSDLYAMGQVLFGLQVACQEASSALVVSTHWSKRGAGDSFGRITGVGPGAWGRVLGSAAVLKRTVDPRGASDVLLRWDFRGGEIGEAAFQVRRRVWAEDPDDLSSPLHYEVEVDESIVAHEQASGLSRTQQRVLAALAALAGTGTLPELAGSSTRRLGDLLARDGKGSPLRMRTIQEVLGDLEQAGLACRVGKSERSPLWAPT